MSLDMITIGKRIKRTQKGITPDFGRYQSKNRYFYRKLK